MLLRTLLAALVLAGILPGCASHRDRGKPPKEAVKPEKSEKPEKPKKPAIADASTDVSFQGFLGRLRIAVHAHDRVMLQSMMAPDFGWRFDAPLSGETAFDYWDQNKLWTELEKLLEQRFGPSESYMVSPPEFISDSSYRGFRCGIRMVNGSWRFAYFVTGEDILQ